MMIYAHSYVAALTTLVISLLVLAYYMIIRLITKHTSGVKQYVYIHMFKLNVAAIIPCVLLGVLMVYGLNPLKPTWADEETVGLCSEHEYDGNGQDYDVVRRLSDGVELIRSKRCEVSPLKCGIIAIGVYENYNCDNRYPDKFIFYNADLTPVSRVKACFCNAFYEDSIWAPLVMYSIILFLLLAVNMIGLSYYRPRAIRKMTVIEP